MDLTSRSPIASTATSPRILSVGAYIASVDGDRLEGARTRQAVRAIGFRTPLWALADPRQLADMAVLSQTGEVDGYIYLGQQTPDLLRKAGRRQPAHVRQDVAAAVLRRADGL